jgi:hypothetical protein
MLPGDEFSYLKTGEKTHLLAIPCRLYIYFVHQPAGILHKVGMIKIHPCIFIIRGVFTGDT